MKKLIIILTAVFVIGAVAAFSLNSSKSENTITDTVTVLNDFTDEIEAETVYFEDSEKPDKSETVYVKADAYGKPTEITVETVLKKTQGGEPVEDFTTLYDIKNKDGGEDFTITEDGTLVWENLGSNIKYEGKSDKDLPVEVSVRYFLDDKEVTAEEIAGKSGEIKIRLDYNNNTQQAVKVNGVNVNTVTPFMALTTIVLPQENFVNVKVENGISMDMDDSTIVLGYAMPGLSDSLKLANYELTKEIHIPEYVEITAYATNFEISFTATVLTTGLFEDIKNSDLSKLDDFATDIDDMEQGVKDMKDGANKLYDGTSAMHDYMTKYIESINSLCDFADGAITVFTATDTLSQSLSQLSAGLSDLSHYLGNMDTVNLDSSLQAAIISLKTDITSLQSGISDISSQLQSISEYKSALETAVNALDSFSGDTGKDNLRSQLDTIMAAEGIDEATRLAIINDVDYDLVFSDILAQARTAKGNILSAIADYDARVTLDIRQISDAVSDIERQATVISASQSQLSGLEEITTRITTLRSTASTLADGAGQLSQGLTPLTKAAQSMRETDATNQIKTAGKSIGTAMEALKGGVKSFRDGLNDFNTDEFTKLGGNNLRMLKNRIIALKQADILYDNFGGKAEGITSDVMFIIETEEVKEK